MTGKRPRTNVFLIMHIYLIVKPANFLCIGIYIKAPLLFLCIKHYITSQFQSQIPDYLHIKLYKTNTSVPEDYSLETCQTQSLDLPLLPYDKRRLSFYHLANKRDNNIHTVYQNIID